MSNYHIKHLEEYYQVYRKSIREPENFWEEVAEEHFMWRKKWDNVLSWDFSKPDVKWFEGAKLNITENCIDRHLVTRGDKTAILFAAACQLGAILSDRDELSQPMHDFGLHLGLAFQLMDDALDYVADSEELGKNVGDDLAEGKPTLPLIYAKQQCQPEDALLIKNCIENGGLEQLETIQKLIRETGAIEYTLQKARAEIAIAKQQLIKMPSNIYTEALAHLADLAVERSF